MTNKQSNVNVLEIAVERLTCKLEEIRRLALGCREIGEHDVSYDLLMSTFRAVEEYSQIEEGMKRSI